MVWGIPKESRWYVDLPEIKRDPAKVKALLKEAGVGADFELTIVAEIGEQVENQILQQQLVTAGINAKVDYVEHGLYVNRRRKGQFMMSISRLETCHRSQRHVSISFRVRRDQERERPDHELLRLLQRGIRPLGGGSGKNHGLQKKVRAVCERHTDTP